MKKLRIGCMGLVVALLLVLTVPMVVGAQDGWEWGSCCQYEGCCWKQCCALQTNWYAVSYFDKVETGFYFHGLACVAGVWTTSYVEAHNADEAAESLGMVAGVDCFVSCDKGYEP